ncbi:MAG: class I SAM-dependent methyltransferase [Caulobacteraceae bacterium]
MLRCLGCGSLFPAAPPPASGAYADYYTAAPPRRGWRPAARALAAQARAAYLRRSTPATARRVLDFGCGAGAYLRAISAPDRRCFGADPFASPPPSATWTPLRPGDIEAAGPFDWITLGHVLEHLDEAEETLRGLARSLAPGARLWIATPNADSFLFRAAGPLARDTDYPRHRQIFSRAGLERLLAAAGLTPVFTSPPRLNAVLNAWASIKNVVRDPSLATGQRLGVATKILTKLFLHLLSPRSRRDRQSPELVAICRGLEPGEAWPPNVSIPRPAAARWRSPMARWGGRAGRC